MMLFVNYIFMKNLKLSTKREAELRGNQYDIQFDIDLKEKPSKSFSLFIKLLMGAIIGFVNGFWGGGGGMICVPILMKVIKLPAKKSHATTLFIMLPLSIASLIVYILNGSLNYYDAFRVGVGFVVGGAIGAVLLNKLSNFWISAIFSLIILAGGVKLII